MSSVYAKHSGRLGGELRQRRMNGRCRGRQQRHRDSRLAKKWSTSWTLYTSPLTAMMMPSRGLASAVRQGARLNRRFVSGDGAQGQLLGLTHARYLHLQGHWLHSARARQVASSKDPSSRSPHMLVLPQRQHLLQVPPSLPPRTLLHPRPLPMPSRPTATLLTLPMLPTMPTCPRD